MRWIALALTLAVGATLGAAIGSSASPRHRAKRCHPTRHHRCPKPRPRCSSRHHHRCKHKPAPRRKHSNTSTTTSPTTSTTTRATTASSTTTTTTSATTTLPTRLEVDENDQGIGSQPYSLLPSHNPVGAGTVQFNVYNFGQDPHTFAIVDAHGRRILMVDVPANQPGTAIPLSASLPAGSYTLECTLSGHAQLGMRASLIVR